MEEDKTEKRSKKVRLSTIIYSIVIAFAVFVIVVAVLIYGFGLRNRVTEMTSKYIPYPAVAVNYNNFITVNSFDDNLDSIRSFYESQDFSKVGLRIDFSTEDGKKRLKVRERQLLDKMVEDRIIEILAKKNGIKITNGAVKQEISRKIKEYGNLQKTEEKLAKLYGWTIDEFAEKIVRPELYREKLSDKFKEINVSNKDVREKIKKAKSELDEGKNFSEIAINYSEGMTAGDGGAMGWFKKEHLMPELADAAFSLEVGKITDSIETDLGYHIIKIEERQIQDSEEVINISQIFIRKNDFAKWLRGKTEEFNIHVFIKGYYWDKDELTMQFEDEGMIEFEKQVLENFQGDTSIAF